MRKVSSTSRPVLLPGRRGNSVPSGWGLVLEERIRVLRGIYERGGSVDDAPWAKRGLALSVNTTPTTPEEDADDGE